MENNMEKYLKSAVLNKDFQGLMSFVVREGDVFEVDASEYKIHHRISTNRGNILGAWARCDRKHKKPFLIYLEFEDHKEEIEEWGNHPSLMIQRKAEEFILKRAFPLEELSKDAEIKTNLISTAQQKRMFAISGGKEDIVRQALAGHGLTSTSQVPREKYDEICSRIEKLSADFTEVETLDVEHPWQ